MIDLILPCDKEIERLAIGAIWVALPEQRKPMLHAARANWFHDPFYRGVFVVLCCYRDLDGEQLQKAVSNALGEFRDSRWRSLVRIFQDDPGNSTCGQVRYWPEYAAALKKLAGQRQQILQAYQQLCEACDEYRVQVSLT